VTRTEAGVPVAFDYTALSATQQTALCYKVSGACVAGNSSLVDYLRGDATYEGAYGMGNSRFRDRNDSTESTYFKRDLIGTIINSGPAYVAIEQNNYQEVSDPGFADFKTTTKARAPALYVPANDGMVHALDAATGNELWAYVPSFVIPTGTDTEGKEKGLRALSYQDSGAPAYSHHFYVDATPKVGAVDFARTGGPIPLCTVKPCTPTPEWKNILVGGLGKGGKGYYALDVTIPATSLSDAKSKVLWEFPRATDTANQARMGYSFGQPLIAKTYAYGWVVMLPSGYNNSDGYGYVFVLNAKTGVLLETLKTTEKTPGMAHITFLAQTNNLYAEQVYGGDLNGNVWRFDFLSHTPAWSLTERVSQIFSSSVSTPITSEVNVSIDVNTNDRWVMFGTGQYLDVPDRETTGTQYLVSLRDGTADAPRTTGGAVALSTLATLSNPTSGSWSCATSGWKYALPTSGERITMNPAADLQTVIFASLIPSSDPCSSGTTGYVYGLDYCSGHNRLKTAGLSLPLGPGGGIPCANGCLPPESPVLGKDGKAKVKIMDGSNGISATIDTSRIYSGTRHVGWRELLNEY
jgi:type IV pilus assembly protein PilY1